MSRRRGAAKRKILPDARYGDIVISRMVNTLMYQGKKSVAERVMYGMLEIVQKKSGQDALKLFRDAVDNIKPQVEVRSRRVGGATYQVPTEVRPERQLALALRWLRDAARNRNEKTMMDKLAAEIMDATNGRGNAVKKREDTHRMADANKAFSHYRW